MAGATLPTRFSVMASLDLPPLYCGGDLEGGSGDVLFKKGEGVIHGQQRHLKAVDSMLALLSDGIGNWRGGVEEEQSRELG